MRLVLQRVSRAAVTVERGEPRPIGPGLVVLVGVAPGDSEEIARAMAQKTVHLRIFSDGDGNMNRSLLDTGGDCLIVSQFTLYADCRRGRRPSFTGAAAPPLADALYRHYVQAVREAGAGLVQTGEFGAHMDVDIHNDGPVTILLDSETALSKSL